MFSLIERAKYPRNCNVYSTSFLSEIGDVVESPSLIDLFVKESEDLHAKVWINRDQECLKGMDFLSIEYVGARPAIKKRTDFLPNSVKVVTTFFFKYK